jgi:hypothetical protein
MLGLNDFSFVLYQNVFINLPPSMNPSHKFSEAF